MKVHKDAVECADDKSYICEVFLHFIDHNMYMKKD